MTDIQTNSKTCKVLECDRENSRQGYCAAHYARVYTHGNPQLDKPLKPSKPCQAKGCERRVGREKYCKTHQRRIYKYGTPKENEPILSRFYGNGKINTGYLEICSPPEQPFYPSQKILEHRLIMSDYLGRTLQNNETVHHKNGNKRDNRLENLELWSSRHPRGQKVEDQIVYALEILEQYRNQISDDMYLRLRKIIE